MPNGTVHLGCTVPTLATARLVIALVSRIEKAEQFCQMERDISGRTDRNDQTGQRGPPSKLVPNIPVGPNRNGPFHSTYQPKILEFWVEWKAS